MTKAKRSTRACTHPSFCYQRRTDNGLWTSATADDATIKRCMSCDELLSWGDLGGEPDEETAISMVAAGIMAGDVMTELHRRGYDRYWAGTDAPAYEQTLTWKVGYLVAAMGDSMRQDVDHMTSTWQAIKDTAGCVDCGAPLGGVCRPGALGYGTHCRGRVYQAFDSVLIRLLVLQREAAVAGDRLVGLAAAAQRLLDDGIHHNCPTCNPLIGAVAAAVCDARRPLAVALPLALRSRLDRDPG